MGKVLGREGMVSGSLELLSLLKLPVMVVGESFKGSLGTESLRENQSL